MYEIRNLTSGPAQIVVRSFSKRRVNAASLTVLNIPGRQTYFVEDERIIDTYLNRSKDAKMLTYNKISYSEFEKRYNPNNKRMKYIQGYKKISEEI